MEGVVGSGEVGRGTEMAVFRTPWVLSPFIAPLTTTLVDPVVEPSTVAVLPFSDSTPDALLLASLSNFVALCFLVAGVLTANSWAPGVGGGRNDDEGDGKLEAEAGVPSNEMERREARIVMAKRGFE